ncbi:hypothetical protein [Helicobacter pylori]|uniref:hypothetical protein n=1 Tax=Helicobacter pylori TaxID=210 RepID=UPI000FDCEF4C|nr:hypothetical protein [Helicobacter pylori]RVY64723.1 hypothetical protein ECC38_05050 [Helicobacter pylori]
MNTKGKNKNASHLTHEMKKEHGGLAKASEKAEMQPILEAEEGYRQAAERYEKAAKAKDAEAKEKMDKIVNTLKAINHDNNTIDIEPED